MTEAEKHFEQVFNQLLSINVPSLIPERCTVEGYPALQVKRQPFAVLYEDSMVFRLTNGPLRSAMALPKTCLWSLPNDASLRQWVVVPMEYHHYWYSLAYAALKTALSVAAAKEYTSASTRTLTLGSKAIQEHKPTPTSTLGWSIKRLALLLDSPSTFLLLTDMEGRYTFANRAFLQRFSFQEQDIIGQPFHITIHPDDVPACMSTVMQCIEHPGKVYSVELRKPEPDGTWATTAWEFIAVADRHGNLIEIQCLGHEISREKHQEADILRLNQQLTEALEERTHALHQLEQDYEEVLAMIAHQIKNQLTAVLLGVDKLQRLLKDSDEPVWETLERINTFVYQMNLSVTMFLTGERTEPSQLVPRHVNLVDMLTTILEQYRPEAERKHITLEPIILETYGEQVSASDTDYTVLTEPVYLHDAVDNLVSNAIKYSPFHRSVRTYIQMVYQAEAGERRVRIIIEDEGPGLSAEDHRHVFQKYAILSAKPTGGELSIGVGLAVVKKLVEALHGRVWCESELGKGARFIIELPVAYA